jgi:hypothetical protein
MFRSVVQYTDMTREKFIFKMPCGPMVTHKFNFIYVHMTSKAVFHENSQTLNSITRSPLILDFTKIGECRFKFFYASK